MFRNSKDNERIINLIGERGEPICAVQAGRMGITSHESVLAALEIGPTDLLAEGSSGEWMTIW